MKVKPNSRESRVEETGPNQFVVKVRALPRENKANQEVVESLARHFQVPKSRVSILRGLGAREKVVEIRED